MRLFHESNIFENRTTAAIEDKFLIKRTDKKSTIGIH